MIPLCSMEHFGISDPRSGEILQFRTIDH